METGARRDAASSSTLGLIIAAVVFAAAFVTAELMVAQPPEKDSRSSSYSATAANAMDVIVSEPGRTSTGTAWQSDPDHLTRFGLALEGQPNFLDYTKIKALRNGTLTAAANGLPDYPEVKAAMGITQGDIHLRTYPVLPSLDDPRWTKETHGRIAYFADYGGALAPANVSVFANKSATDLNVSVAIRNDADFDATFAAKINLGAQGDANGVIHETRHTRLLAPGEVQTVWVDFPQLKNAYSSTITGVNVDVNDAFGNPAVDDNGNRALPTYVATTPPSAGGSTTYGFTLAADEPYAYVGGTAPSFTMDRYDNAGSDGISGSGTFQLYGPNGARWTTQAVTWSANGVNAKPYNYACPNCTSVGNYTIVALDASGNLRALDVFHLAAAKMFTAKSTPSAIATTEIGYLSNLVGGFHPTLYDAATNPTGDVFSDDTNGGQDLASVLSRYTTVVIGSEVAQTALTPNTVKQGLADWVQAGGNLVVLGTTTQRSEWLQPIYHAAQLTASGGISAPDQTAPILVSPNKLDYQSYLDRDRAWSIDTAQPFTHVLTRGPNGNSIDDTLAVSNAGSIGNGTVVLTSYTPGSLTSPQDGLEAQRFLSNLMSQSYTMLFLDYGPQIPPGVPVGSESRLVAVPHPNVPGAVVEVRLVLYVFG